MIWLTCSTTCMDLPIWPFRIRKWSFGLFVSYFHWKFCCRTPVLAWNFQNLCPVKAVILISVFKIEFQFHLNTYLLRTIRNKHKQISCLLLKVAVYSCSHKIRYFLTQRRPINCPLPFFRHSAGTDQYTGMVEGLEIWGGEYLCGGHNMPTLVEIGLIGLPKSVGACAPNPPPPIALSLVHLLKKQDYK